MKTVLALASSLLVSAFALPASATAILAGSGWQDDVLEAANAPTINSPWTFSLSGPGVFRVTDAFLTGDNLWLYEGANLLAASTLVAKASLGPSLYDSAWTSDAYAKIEYFLGAGSYSFKVIGDGGGGLPAGFGVRLDTISSAVPEPATWAMLIVGFGLVGGTMRSTRRRQVSMSPA